MTAEARPGGVSPSLGTSEFLSARDFLLRHRDDYDTARAEFRWPRPAEFNWALDWFDAIGLARTAQRSGSSTRTAASSGSASAT